MKLINRIVIGVAIGTGSTVAAFAQGQTDWQAPDIEKLVKSAVANAENRSNDVDVDQLIIAEAYVNEGPRQKRVRPAPMGRAYRYQRRTSHIVVKVAEKGTN